MPKDSSSSGAKEGSSQSSTSNWTWTLELLTTPFAWIPAIVGGASAPVDNELSEASADEEGIEIESKSDDAPGEEETKGPEGEQPQSTTVPSSNPSTTSILEKLSGGELAEVFKYLEKEDVLSTAQSKKSILKEAKDSGALDERKRLEQADGSVYRTIRETRRRFCYLIAIEGEDNQNKAEAQIMETPANRRSDLIIKKGKIRDVAGREFNNLSPYGYAFWAGDTRMCRMMEQYMDDGTKEQAYAECQRIASEGVTYTFQGETVAHSTQFDFQPLIAAYKDWVAEAESLMDAKNWNPQAWADADELWLNIGKEQAKVPTHVAQEYCSNVRFEPTPHFNPDTPLPTPPTVKFRNLENRQIESWTGPREGTNSGLGLSFTVYKADLYPRCGGAPGVVRSKLAGTWASLRCDRWAITALCAARTNDRAETLARLAPEPEDEPELKSGPEPR